MTSSFITEISSIPFFSTVTFGIIAMVITGSSWCFVGLVMGDAPKKGISPALVQLTGSTVSTCFGLCILLITGNFSGASALVTSLVMADYFVIGSMNFLLMMLMSYAMQRGPNGVIWCIVQSAMLFPFLSGVLFFGVQLNVFRICGIILLLAALFSFGMTKDNTFHKQSGSWRIPAFAGLAVAAIQQCLATMPSYYAEAREVSSITRTLSASAGVAFWAIFYTWLKATPDSIAQLKKNLVSKTLWKYILVLQGFGLVFAYTLQYPGLDTMAKNGLGGMCYPMLVGSCILSFTAASIWLLKEKVKLLQVAALISCIAGLICICI